MWLRPGDTLIAEFCTSRPSNGASANADSLPAVVLAKNGVVDANVTVNVSLIETGRYKAECEIPDEYEAGDIIALRVTATVSTVTGRDTLAETRLIYVDFTQSIAEQLFVDGVANLLKVNADHSVNGEVVLSPESLAAITASINASTLTANQIAAALAGNTEVILFGPLISGKAHTIVRGSAYLHSIPNAPYVRIPKAMYNLTGASADFRMKLDRQNPVVVAAAVIDYDDEHYEVYANLPSTKTDDLLVGTGYDQFWATFPGGAQVCLSRCYLEVIEGINVPF